MAAEAGQEAGAQIDAGQVWRAIGQVEGRLRGLEDSVQALREEMREIRVELRDIRAQIQALNKRIDRLLFFGIASVLALLGTLIGMQVFG